LLIVEGTNKVLIYGGTGIANLQGKTMLSLNGIQLTDFFFILFYYYYSSFAFE
jgi:hypothetical protein